MHINTYETKTHKESITVFFFFFDDDEKIEGSIQIYVNKESKEKKEVREKNVKQCTVGKL